MTSNIKFLRVLGIRAKDPGVIALVDGNKVTWSTRRPWDCECLTDDDDLECIHIADVRELLDPRVTTPIERQQRIRRSGSLK